MLRRAERSGSAPRSRRMRCSKCVSSSDNRSSVMLRFSCTSARYAQALSTRPALATSAIIVPAMRARRLTRRYQSFRLRTYRFCRKSIAGAMDRVQELDGEVLVDRGAQRVHVGAQEIALWRRVAPQLALQFLARHHAVRILQQDDQQPARRRVELQALAAALRLQRVEIEAQIADTEDARRFRQPRPPHQRLEPRVQLHERERLDQVVVGAGLEAFDLV